MRTDAPAGNAVSASAVQLVPQNSTRPGLFGATASTTTASLPLNSSLGLADTSRSPLKTFFRLLRSKKMYRTEKTEKAIHYHPWPRAGTSHVTSATVKAAKPKKIETSPGVITSMMTRTIPKANQ